MRAMIDLALYSEQEAVSISSIALRQNISESYLEQLMAKLKKAGLVISTRGAQGGYRLALPMCEISVGDVLRALEGDLRAVECTAHTDEGCQGEELCVTKYVWQRINESIARTVDEMMLDQLVADSIDRPVITGPIEGAAIGNLLAQAMALGDIQDISELREVVRRSEPVERWTPNHTEIWEDGYKRLLSLLENA